MTQAELQTVVLCVLSDEQRRSVEPELRFLLPRGLIVFEPSAERALDNAIDLHPTLILVGADTGTMDGTEFVAALQRKHPLCAWEVVVLPDPDDPFPPVHYSLDPNTGPSCSKWTTRETILEFIAQSELAS